MKIQKYLFSLVLLILISDNILAQLPKDIKAEIEIDAIGTSKNVVPFWMRANKFGSIPLSGLSSGILGSIQKE